MRPSFPIWIFCSGLLLAGAPSASAQQRNHSFTYEGKKYDGSFKFSMSFVREENPGDPQPLREGGGIDMNGSESGKLRFVFYTDGLKFDKNNHKEKYRLVVRPACHGGSGELRDLSQGNLEVKYSRDRNEKTLEYEIRANGQGELRIGFDVVKNDDDSTRCTQAIVFPYNITGIPDPAVRACEQVLAAFKSNKFGNIRQLESLKNKYPGAPCRENIDKILAQHALWKQADDAYKTDCKKAKEICAKYKTEYPGGDFAAEMDMIAKCASAPAPPPPPVVKTKESDIPPEEKEYNLIKADDTDALLAFIDKWGALKPDSRFVQMARKRIAGLLPLQYEEKTLPDGRREYHLLNADRPRLKDMSLRNGLEIETDRLLSDNIFTAKIGAGEYALLVKDAKGKQVTIKITNEFDAALTPLPGGNGWLLRVGGGKKPYRVYLADAANPKDEKTWKGSLTSDTLAISQAELKNRGYDKAYRVVVRDSDRPVKQLDAGLIESAGDNGGSALLDTIMFILLLFVMLCAAYGLYLLLWYRREKQRKATIYERIQ